MLLYYISDRHAFAGNEDEQRQALLRRAGEAAAAGVDYIQLREKDLSSRELERLAKEVLKVVRSCSNSSRVLINERTDIALACGADGVHLPGKSLPPSEVRSIWMRSAASTPVIGVSAHSADEVQYARAHGADFAVLAPIFEKPDADVLGLGLLSAACRAAAAPDDTEAAPHDSFPVLALGGVKLNNAVACLRAGAAGVAAIRLFQEGEVSVTAHALRQINRGCN